MLKSHSSIDLIIKHFIDSKFYNKENVINLIKQLSSEELSDNQHIKFYPKEKNENLFTNLISFLLQPNTTYTHWQNDREELFTAIVENHNWEIVKNKKIILKNMIYKDNVKDEEHEYLECLGSYLYMALQFGYSNIVTLILITKDKLDHIEIIDNTQYKGVKLLDYYMTVNNYEKAKNIIDPNLNELINHSNIIIITKEKKQINCSDNAIQCSLQNFKINTNLYNLNLLLLIINHPNTDLARNYLNENYTNIISIAEDVLNIHLKNLKSRSSELFSIESVLFINVLLKSNPNLCKKYKDEITNNETIVEIINTFIFNLNVPFINFIDSSFIQFQQLNFLCNILEIGITSMLKNENLNKKITENLGNRIFENINDNVFLQENFSSSINNKRKFHQIDSIGINDKSWSQKIRNQLPHTSIDRKNNNNEITFVENLEKNHKDINKSI